MKSDVNWVHSACLSIGGANYIGVRMLCRFKRNNVLFRIGCMMVEAGLRLMFKEWRHEKGVGVDVV